MNEYRVLCVDDEPNILQSLKRLLRKEPYALALAGSADEGLKHLAEAPAQVVVSDQRMPGMTGVEFLQKVKELYPSTVRVILSGYADVGTIVEAINKGEVFRFFAKPWNDDDLRTGIRQCLEHYELVWNNHLLMCRVQEQNDELNRMNRNLDDIVQSRTRSLEMAQEILTMLPVPVLGIGADGLIVMMNSEVARRFPDRAGLVLGENMAAALNPDELKIVQKSLDKEEAAGADLLLPDTKPARFVVVPMKRDEILIGLVAVWMEMFNGKCE